LSSAKGSFPKLLTKQLTKEMKMKYLVMVSDLVARQVYVDASSREEALENANYGVWRLPEDLNMKR
jgi:hypothetical protein